MSNYFGVELSTGGGVDFQTDANGQPLFDLDTFDDDAALRGSLIRMLNQIPRVLVSGTYMGEPDDPYHPDDGVGLPFLVDKLWTVGLRGEIETQILEGLATFAQVLDEPPPTVAQSITPAGRAAIVVTYTRITGETRTLPTILLSVSGG